MSHLSFNRGNAADEDLIQEIKRLGAALVSTGEKRTHGDGGVDGGGGGAAPVAVKRREQDAGLYNAAIKRFWEAVSDDQHPLTAGLNILSLSGILLDQTLAACPSDTVLASYLARLFVATVPSLWAENHYELAHLRRVAPDGTIICTYRGDALPTKPKANESDDDDARTRDYLHSHRHELSQIVQAETDRYQNDLTEYANQWKKMLPKALEIWICQTILVGQFESDAVVWAVLLQLWDYFDKPTDRDFTGVPTDSNDPWLVKSPYARHDLICDYQFSELRGLGCDRLVRRAPSMAEHMMKVTVPIIQSETVTMNMALFDAAIFALEDDLPALASLILDVLDSFVDMGLMDIDEVDDDDVDGYYLQFGKIASIACYKGHFDIVRHVCRLTDCSWGTLHALRLGLDQYASSHGLYHHLDSSPAELFAAANQGSLPTDDDPLGNDDSAARVIIRRVLFSSGSMDFISKLAGDLAPGETIITTLGYDPTMLQQLFCHWSIAVAVGDGDHQHKEVEQFLTKVIGADKQQSRDIVRASMVMAAESAHCTLELLSQMFEIGFGGRYAEDVLATEAANAGLRISMAKELIKWQTKHPFGFEMNQWILGVLLPSYHDDAAFMWADFINAASTIAIYKLLPFLPEPVSGDQWIKCTAAVVWHGTHYDANMWFERPRFRRYLELAHLDAHTIHWLVEGALHNPCPGIRRITLPTLFKFYPLSIPATRSSDMIAQAQLLNLLHQYKDTLALEWAVKARGDGVCQITKEVEPFVRPGICEWIASVIPPPLLPPPPHPPAQ